MIEGIHFFVEVLDDCVGLPPYPSLHRFFLVFFILVTTTSGSFCLFRLLFTFFLHRRGIVDLVSESHWFRTLVR